MPRRLLDRITNKRELLARAFGSLGLIGLLEQIALRRPALVVLTYHRIAVPGNASNPYYDPPPSSGCSSCRVREIIPLNLVQVQVNLVQVQAPSFSYGVVDFPPGGCWLFRLCMSGVSTQRKPR